MFLDVLFHDVKLDYQTPIISQQGEVAGRLHIEIEKTGGSLNLEPGEPRLTPVGDDEENEKYISCKLTIKAATGLPPSLSQFVFCQYSFPGEGETTTVPPSLNPNPRAHSGKIDTGSVNYKFEHRREWSLPVTEELLEHCAEGALREDIRRNMLTKIRFILTPLPSSTSSGPFIRPLYFRT